MKVYAPFKRMSNASYARHRARVFVCNEAHRHSRTGGTIIRLHGNRVDGTVRERQKSQRKSNVSWGYRPALADAVVSRRYDAALNPC